MRKTIKQLVCIAIMAFAAISCDESESILYSGEDNYITKLQITTADGEILTSTILEDEIVLRMLNTVSLEGAKVEYAVSENATISPNPSEVTDWESQDSFAVTAYNKTERIYKFTIVKTENITLLTQADVDNFAALEQKVIDGNLYIGGTDINTDDNEDPITSLSGLQSLTTVTQDVIVRKDQALVNLDGLQNLVSIGEFSYENSNTPEEGKELTVNLPKLKRVGRTFTINSALGVKAVDLDALEYIGGDCYIYSKILAEAKLSNLEVVSGDFTIKGYNTSATIEKLNLSSLTTVGGDFSVQNLTLLTELSYSNLKSVGGSITMSELLSVTEHNFEKIDAESIVIDSNFNPKLAITLSDDFDDSLEITANSQQPDMSDFITINNLKRATDIDIKLSTFDGNIVLNDLEIVDGTLNFASCNELYGIELPKLKSVKALFLTYNNGLVSFKAPVLSEIKGLPYVNPYTELITRVDGLDAKLASKYLETFSMPSLKTVDGNFSITGLTSSTILTKIDVPNLETVANDLNIESSSYYKNESITDFNSFSNLTSAGKITIKNFNAIKSFEGFKNVINSLDNDKWIVSGCNYNPTYDEMVAEEYTEDTL